MASWHQAQRMQRELYHGQESLLNDLPVLIPAQSLPRVANGSPCSPSPSERDFPSAEKIGTGSTVMPVPGDFADRWALRPEPCARRGTPGSETNNNGPARKPWVASAGGASQETS